MLVDLGIDGGGTRTAAVIGDETGAVLYRFYGESINYNAIGLAASRSNFRQLLSRIAEETGITHFRSVFIGSSALAGEADELTRDAFCAGLLEADYIGMDSDLTVALAAADTGLPHAVVISGTGSMAAGLDADGALHTKGGWGHLLGDEGSAYEIALSGLREAIQQYENGEETPLTAELKGFFGIRTLPELIPLVYNPPIGRNRLAAFCPAVFAAAHKGDSRAQRVISRAVSALSETALRLLSEAAFSEVYLYGGVFLHQEVFAAEFTDKIHARYPELPVKLLSTTPEEGALRLARSRWKEENE